MVLHIQCPRQGCSERAGAMPKQWLYDFPSWYFAPGGSIRGAAPLPLGGSRCRRGPAGNLGRAPGAHGASDTWWSPFGSARELPQTLPLQTGSPAPALSTGRFHRGDVISGWSGGLLFYPDHDVAADSVEGPDDLWKVKICCFVLKLHQCK